MFAKWYISLQIRKKIKIKFNNLLLVVTCPAVWVKWFVDPSVCVSYVCMFSISSLLFWSCETCMTARVWFCEIDAFYLVCFEREALWTISCRCISCLSICEYKWSFIDSLFSPKKYLLFVPRTSSPWKDRFSDWLPYTIFITCLFEFLGVIKKFSE